MELIKFENVNLQRAIKAIAGLVVFALIIELIDKIENAKPGYYYPAFAYTQPKKRNDFTESTKKDTLFRQGYRCAMCFQLSQLYDFHHKDGNRSNNQPANCEALCPNCHRKMHRKRS